MANYLNKSSAYVGSLVEYILDTKPYHSKLTEVVEEYQFFDRMDVRIEERSSIRTKINPTWLYNFYSGGDPTVRTMPVKQLHQALQSVFPPNVHPSYRGAIKVARDENTDLASVPFVYSKKAFDGPGVADVLIERNGNRSTLEPLIEGLDWFQSHGSMQFQIKQTSDAGTNFVPSWAETRDDNIISTVSALTRQLANDLSNPTSAVRKIRALLTEINTIITAGLATATGTEKIGFETAQIAYLDLWNQTSIPTLPTDYELLLNSLSNINAPPPAGFTGWLGNNTTTEKFVSDQLSAYTPNLYFNKFSDAGVRESGQSGYDEVASSSLRITNITVTAEAVPGDTWTVVAKEASSTSATWHVISSIRGYVGAVTATAIGAQFTSSTINFTATFLQQPTINETLSIYNHNRLVFGPTAPLETWNIIKVNPIAYDRPVFHSARYGFIQSLTNVVGDVSILDRALPTSTITLTARANGTTFDLTSDAEPTYTGVVTVNAPYNDGRLGFTITTGSAQPFVLGDKFYISIVNDSAVAQNLDLGYGYDLDSYDNQSIVDDQGVPLNFAYGTRFTDYDLDSLNLVVSQLAVDQRQWRLRAIPALDQPIATLKKDGSGPSHWIDLQDATSGVAQDPALTAPPLYSMTGDVTPDLQLYRAESFALEYSHDDFKTVTSVATVPVGASYSNSAQGLSFTLTPGSKPFVAVRAVETAGGPLVEGGDLFTFTVLNSDPYLDNAPLNLISANTARLAMIGDGFHEAPAATWSVTFSSATNYVVSGIQADGSEVLNGPWSAHLTTPGLGPNENTSFKRGGVHFTIIPGKVGLAAGDKFTFTTFARKPTYLVHGSVSGWQEDAVVGEAYWNGIIGFTIQKPKAQLFNVSNLPVLLSNSIPNVWGLPGGAITVARLRDDADNSIYSLIPTPVTGTKTGWYVYHDYCGAVGHLPLNGTFKDDFITLVADHVAVAGCIPLKLKITADDFMLWNAQDTVILRSTIAAKLPKATDYLLVDKRTNDRLAINFDYSSLSNPPSLTALAPETQDIRFIDTYTGPAGLPLENTSPETAIVRNYIPLTLVPYDSPTSIAEFSDSAKSFDVYAAGNGQAIGTLRDTSSTSNWPTQFKWDLTFFNQYLPLNAAANIVTYGNGFNDNLNVRIRESIKFLIDSGSLTTDFMFKDEIKVDLIESHNWTIFEAVREAIDVAVNDGPFGGFLPGYGNTALDFERGGDINLDGRGYYSIGLPLTDHFHQAKELTALTALSTAQQEKLATLTAQLGNYLNGSVANTTLEFFLAAIDAADPLDFTPVADFGYPAVGAAFDITIGAKSTNPENSATEGAASQIQDALVVLAIDKAIGFDQDGLDIGGLDAQADRTAIIYSGSLPPVPSPLATSSDYENFETPLAIVGGTARVFEIAFKITAATLATVTAMPPPRVFIWLPTWPTPQQATIVEKIAVGKYRVAVPAATEAKLYLES